jgi:acid phosphatase (class A)
MLDRRYLLALALTAAAFAASAATFAPPAPVAATSMSAPATVKSAEPAAPRILTPRAVDFATLLPAPPRADSQEAREEMEVVLRMQQSRTPTEVERAKSEAKLTMTAFSSVVGPWFTPQNLPLTAALLKAAEKDSKYFSGSAKDYFGRKRPPSDPRVTPLIDEGDEPSYPSGHATRGVLFATIIAELDPAQRAVLMDRAREIGWDRVIAGVHYPSDIVAGRVLGQALAQALLANPGFQEKLAAARREFATASAKNAPVAATAP